MDYSKLNDRIIDKVLKVVALINNPEISPEVRQLYHERLFKAVGSAVYNQVYDMNAFDMEIDNSKGTGIDDRYYGMAKIASHSVSAGGDVYMKAQVITFLDQMTAKAQKDAMQTAKESGKHPTVTRIEPATSCKFCKAREGTFTDPDARIFQRHKKCRGNIYTKGYKSRNGLLDNYVKPKDR